MRMREEFMAGNKGKRRGQCRRNSNGQMCNAQEEEEGVGTQGPGSHLVRDPSGRGTRTYPEACTYSQVQIV